MPQECRFLFLTIPPCRTARDDDDDVYYSIGERLKLEGEAENMGVSAKKRKGMKAVVLMATSWPLPAPIQWEVKVGGKSMEEVRGASFAGSLGAGGRRC